MIISGNNYKRNKTKLLTANLKIVLFWQTLQIGKSHPQFPLSLPFFSRIIFQLSPQLMVVAFLSKRYKLKIREKDFPSWQNYKASQEDLDGRYSCPFDTEDESHIDTDSGAGRQIKPVSLDIPLACLNDYLLGFLSLQPNIGKREIKLSLISFQFYKQWWKTSHQTSSSVSTHPLTRISTKEIPARLSSSSSGVSSFMKFPMEYISIHFSAFSITIIYTPLILT